MGESTFWQRLTGLAKEKEQEASIPSISSANAVTEPEDDTELIAVIMAAIAASLNQPISGLVISKIRRVTGNSTTWSQAGLNECIASRRF